MELHDRIRNLSPRQRECLRLVLVRKGSKEIARDLGISSHTVDDHLRAAVKILAVSTRFEAARLFSEHDDATPQALGGGSLRIPEPTKTVTYEEAPDLGATLQAPQEALTVQEARMVYETIQPPLPLPATKLRLFTWGIERNDLSLYQRLFYVAVLMVGIGIATGVAVVGMVGVTALIRAVFSGSSAHITF